MDIQYGILSPLQSLGSTVSRILHLDFTV